MYIKSSRVCILIELWSTILDFYNKLWSGIAECTKYKRHVVHQIQM